MRKTIIFGALAALLGLTAVVQASDDDRSFTPGSGQVAQERSTDGRDSDHDRYQRREHASDMRENHDNDRDSNDRGRERHHRDRN